jgi:hypothetical protein
MTWELSEPLEGVKVVVDEKGVWLTGHGLDLTGCTGLEALQPRTRLGRLLPALIPQLVQLGIAYPKTEGVLIEFDDYADLEGTDIDAFDDLVPWSPFAIELETKGSVGMSDFRYQTIFYWGLQQVHVERLGCFVKRGDKIYRLERQIYRLLEAVDAFNSLPSSEKVKPAVLPKFAEIKGIAQDVGAQLNQYVLAEKVIIPAKIDLDLVEEKDGRISFYPKVDRVPEHELFRVFMASDDVDEVYAVPDGTGGRIRVILDDLQKEVLRRMRKVRHLGGADKAKVLRNPYEVFDGVASSVEIDLARFGPRVKGIGDFPFVSQPFVKYEGTGVFDSEDESGSGQAVRQFNAGIKCTYPDGTEEKVYFDSKKEILDLFHQAKLAFQTGQETVDYKGKTIVVDKAFIEGLGAVTKRITETRRDPEDVAREQAYLLIYTNEEELEYREDERGMMVDESDLFLPQALLDESTLKQYQKEGIKWLQRNYLLYEKAGRKGCLLADEMGLGKTFQVLAFLAWLIERGGISPTDVQTPEKPPWNPILVVEPLMLIENESWQRDMRKFFKYEGAVFEPHLVLHGAELKRRRRPDVKGRETELRESVLKLEELRQYRMILTSYETVINYQFSFAMMKDAWTAVVTDEAQEYKTPNTKISHALKSLAPRIRIACTGTPVETKLIDVWNILDFLQPGVLGSASEFATMYEKPIIEKQEKRDEVLADLKTRIHFGKPHAYVLRRDKKSILHELPEKHEHKEYCDLTAEQRERHLDFINEVRKGGHPLSVLPQLMKLYQHPGLIPVYQGIRENEVDEALARSPKLKKVVDLLRDIRLRREKALIFTRSLDMQQMLSTVISGKFGLHVDIINGAMPRAGGTKSGARTRKEGIQRFCESDGFNVLIVSPEVAGVGLTIVEANHVIHYGRWWNPAKEMQATDRVYRIGQNRDVHVYYPIARDQEGKIVTFDERLDNLLDRRRELASEFLSPMPGDVENQADLVRDLIGDDEPLQAARPLSEQDIRALPWDRFEALVALMEERNRKKVILTPKSGDYGVDVLSADGKQILLIQCKHTTWGSPCDTDVIAETINAFDNYKSRWLRNARGVVLHPRIVTNGTFTKSARKIAQEHDISYFGLKEFLRMVSKNPCTLAEIESMENRRKSSMKEVEVEIREWVSA